MDGDDVAFTQAPPKLIIDEHVWKGEHFSVEVIYDGTPDRGAAPGRTGNFGWVIDDEGVHTTVVLPGDMASIIPLNDTPLDPATWTLTITVPRPHVALASGTLVERVDGDDSSTFRWRVDHPVSEVAWAAGDLVSRTIADDVGAAIDIEVAAPADATVRWDDFDAVPEMIVFLAERLGPFPYDSVGFTWVPGLGALGDSTPGRIHLSSSAESILVHELAHQWMGGLVSTASSTEAWMREGLCRYMELIWVNRDATALDDAVAQIRTRLGARTRPPLEVTEAVHRADDVAYERGALTFHALHVTLGDDKFWAVLSGFFERHAGTSATTDDFVTYGSEVTGIDVGELLAPWLRSEQLPPEPG